MKNRLDTHRSRYVSFIQSRSSKNTEPNKGHQTRGFKLRCEVEESASAAVEKL